MANKKNAIILQEYLLTRRRDELLLEKGELPIKNTASASGTVPATGSGQPVLNNVPSATNPMTDVKAGATPQTQFSSNPSYQPPVTNPANPPHVTGASNPPQAASQSIQPQAANHLNQPQAANHLNQPQAANASYAPQAANRPATVNI
jgi:hypothetical protein